MDKDMKFVPLEPKEEKVNRFMLKSSFLNDSESGKQYMRQEMTRQVIRSS